MPKIIKDLKPQIKHEAMIMFEEVGYEKVSMRQLAKAVGIAVGTLYNYFPDKDTLYRTILTESWQQTHDQIMNFEPPYSEETMNQIIEIMYDHIVDRKGLGKILIAFNGTKINTENVSGELQQIFEDILSRTMDILKSLNHQHVERKAYLLVVNTARLVEIFPEEKEKNLMFIRDIFLGGRHE